MGSGRDNQITPFLSKCYTMVDDPSTDSIISWGSFNTSFIIWDVITFEQELLPKYYKHRNFSSFIRQLNQYGFKKYEPDRWEFINDGFVKGQRHMLKNIRRKKSIQGNCEKSKSEDSNTSARKNSSKTICQQNQSQGTNTHTKTDLFQGNFQQNDSQGNITSTRIKSSQGNIQQNDSQENNTLFLTEPSQANGRQNQLQESNTSAGECVQIAEFRLWQDVENLKKDKNVVMQELAKLSHNQQGADGKLHSLGQRLQGMEISQQQLLSFLAMVVQSPGFLVKLLQQNETTWCISETNKKRPYLALEQDTDVDEPVACDGQIVKYQPPIHEMPKPLLTSTLRWDESQPLDPSANGLDDFFKNIDLMSSGEGMQVAMEENGNSVNEGQFIIPDSLEDGTMENLLLAASELLDDDETTGPNSAEAAGESVDPYPTDDNSSDEPSQALDRFTEELELLLLETNNEDGLEKK